MCIRKFDFAFIGGDMRQVYMINNLVELGYSVIVYGLEDPLLCNNCNRSDSIEETILSSYQLILPIPIVKGDFILSKSNIEININDIKKYLSKIHTVYGGVFPQSIKSYLESNDISYYDFMEDENVILYNSIATAEGTIAHAINNSNINLHDSSILILGYGRCAITLAHKMKSLSNQITISARKQEQLSAAHTAQFSILPLTQLKDSISNYDFIFNTIPSLVLSPDLLDLTNNHVVIVDIASSPGGVDFDYAKKINRYANLYLGIPGKIAPKSSALYLNSHLLNYLGKK